VRLSKIEKRLRAASLEKSSSDTAECHWSQSGHDIFSNPFDNSPFTVYLLVRRNVGFRLVGSGDEGGIKLGMKALSEP
jgi:hypothetical protein